MQQAEGSPPLLRVESPGDAKAAAGAVLETLRRGGVQAPGGQLNEPQARAAAEQLWQQYLAGTGASAAASAMGVASPPAAAAAAAAEPDSGSPPPGGDCEPPQPTDMAALHDASSVLLEQSNASGSRRPSGIDAAAGAEPAAAAPAQDAQQGQLVPAAEGGAAADAPPPVDAESERRMLNILNHYAPKQLPIVYSTLQQYRGHEEALLQALISCYGPEPGTADGPPAPMAQPLADGWREVRKRGHVFYRHDADGKKQWSRPVAPRE